MKDIFNRNIVQKYARELMHSMERYKDICVRIIAKTTFYLKCIIMTSDWIHQFRCFLRQINPYHFTECVDSLADFCTIFLLKMSFILSFYIHFTFIKCCTKYKIPKFIIPTLIHQLRNNFYIYITIKCIYTNYVVNIRHIRHQIDKLCGGLPPVSVYGSGVAQIIVSSITESVFHQ